MKKVFLYFLFVISLFLHSSKANAVTYTEASKSQKPMALFIYADWADNLKNMQEAFNNNGQKYNDKFNFVMLNIADEDAKEYNKRFYIYPNLPYVILMRDNGKVSRYLKNDCVMSKSCFEEKLKFFIN